MRGHALQWAAAAAVGLAMLAGPARAQNGQSLKRPVIGGHSFLVADLVPDPFPRTYVRQSLGVAQAVDVEWPLVIVGGDTLTLLKGDLTYAILDFEYQHAVKPWLAARGRFLLRSRLGSSGTTLFAEGIQVNTGFEFGWLVRLLQTERVILSASADVARRSFNVVDLDGFVQDILNGASDPQLTDRIPVVRGTGGVRFAWGISSLVGLTALAEAGYGDAQKRGEAGDFVYATGGFVDFDLGAVTPVDIGVGVGFFQTSAIDQIGADSDSRTGALRIGYTGREDFLIGVDLLWNGMRDASLDKTVSAIGAALTMRYYF